MLSVCYVISYRRPNVIRTRTLISALHKIDTIKVYQARNTSKGIWRYFQTLWKMITIRVLINPEFYILGFRGYELFWPVRLISLGKRLIYDHMMSPYDGFLNERKSLKSGSIIEKLVYLYEKSILNSADVVLTDTEIHKRYFQMLFNIDSHKIYAIPIGADEEVFNITKNTPNSYESGIFEILFYGSFLPLHGIDIILDAASRLHHLPIHFTLIGGEQADHYVKVIEQSPPSNITHIEWVEFERLPQFVSSADIGLGGPFGNTGQAHRVVTAKTFQFFAMAKPVIIGKSSPDYGFEDKNNCLMIPQGDGKALADAIMWAFDHRDKIGQIGLRGFELYRYRYSIKQITKKIENIISHEI